MFPFSIQSISAYGLFVSLATTYGGNASATDWLEITGWLATAVALTGVWLNNRRRRACFLLWLASNVVTFGIHAWSGLWSLAARDVAFFVLAIHGWRLWRGTDARREGSGGQR